MRIDDLEARLAERDAAVKASELKYEQLKSAEVVGNESRQDLDQIAAIARVIVSRLARHNDLAVGHSGNSEEMVG